MDVIVMNVSQDSWGLEMLDGAVMDGDKAEHVKEAAAVVGQYCDIIGVWSFRGLADRDLDYRDEVIGQFVRYAGVPVIVWNPPSGTRRSRLPTRSRLKNIKKQPVRRWYLPGHRT